MFNLVELIADDADQAFDQRCAYGHRLGEHAVYCHNDKWKDAPMKCRRTWYWGEDEEDCQDEDCPGYEPNPRLNIKGHRS